MKIPELIMILFLTAPLILVSAAVTAQSDAAREWYDRGLIETDPDKAIEYYTKAVSVDPDYTWAYNKRGLLYYFTDRYVEAVADFSRIISIDPNFIDAYYNRGNAYYFLKEYKKAVEDYTKAISIDPYYIKAYTNRGVTYRAMGENVKARADFRKACDGGVKKACDELKK